MNSVKANKSGYYSIIENMPVGLVCLKSMTDSHGETINYIFSEVNRSFEQLVGLKRQKLLGKRVTDVSTDGKIAGFDFKDICSKIETLQDNMKFEHYSDKHKKWYLIYSYKSQEDSFCVVFRDISEIKDKSEKINIIYESAVKFHEISYLDIDYQLIANELLRLSGAIFVLVNIFSREKMKTVTCGFSGLGIKTQQVVKMLGFNIIGKEWSVGEADQEVMKSKKLVKIGRLHEFNFGRIPPTLVNMVERATKLGDSFGVGITCNDEVLGSFIIMMREGESIKSPDIVELYVNQLGIMLIRKKAEEEVIKLDQEYKTVFNGTQDAMFLINVAGEKNFVYHMVNNGYAAELKMSCEKFIGMTPRDLHGEEYGKEIEERYMDCIAAQKPIWYEEEVPFLGRMRIWHSLLSPVIIDGKVVQIVGSSRDISRQKQWEHELARERQLFKVTIHSIGDAVITTDTENRIVILNKVAEELTGWDQEEARGRLLNEVMTTTGEKRYDLPSYSSIEGQTNENQHLGNEILISRNGSRRIISSSKAFIRDEDTSILGVVIVFRDVTLEKQKEEEVRYLGYHDKLTGLYNRAYFEEELQRMDNEMHLPLGLIMGDFNGLKMANDVFGHEEGDRLLKRIAEIFKSICSNEGIVARVGGDEFVVILPGISQEKLNGIISSIKQRCSSEIDEPISPNIALGAAIKENKDQDIKKIYKLAEDRMYNNKLAESKSIRSSIISSLKKTLEERTHETEAHAHRLKELSMKLGSIMNLYDNEMDELLLLAVLHDIGKIAIPDYILGKPGRLTEDEWKIMKNHCEIGYRIAVASPELASIASLILSHHERWDGTGYPQGLKGEEMPLLSRIIAVVDAYDAMTNDRPYHSAVSSEAALRELERCSGTQFDPYIVEQIIEVISK